MKVWLGCLCLLYLFVSANSYAFNLLTSNEANWNTDEVRVDFNTTGCPTSINLESDLERAFDISWNSIASSRLRLVKGAASTSTTPDTGKILIRCTAQGTTGPGGVTSISTLGEDIVTGEITMNSDLDWASFGGSEAVAFVIGHELGHAIGFSHSDSEEAMMFFSGIRETIASDDVDAATYLYPRNDISDGPFGCGTISKNMQNPTDGLVKFSFLLLILGFLTLGIKMRMKQIVVQ